MDRHEKALCVLYENSEKILPRYLEGYELAISHIRGISEITIK